jgi:hypothetical protein
MVKVKAHRGEPLNARADTEAERARQLPEECRQCTNRTHRMTYEWYDKCVKRKSAWSKAVRYAMRKGGTEFRRQKVLTKAAGNWSKEFIRTTDAGWAQVRRAACTGVKCDFIDNKRWGWDCMLQLQEQFSEPSRCLALVSEEKMGEREAQSTAARASERASVPERGRERERKRETSRIDSKGIGWASAETSTCRENRRS